MSEPETGGPNASSDPESGSPASSPSEAKRTDDGVVAFAEEEVQAEAPEAKEPDPLEVAKAEAAKYREQLLRTAADFENFRKRTRREVDDATRKGKEQALKDLLPVFDNMERAVTSAESAPDVKSVLDGLRMINRQFIGTLEKMNIRRVKTVGNPFDPSQHEAIQHVESTEHAAGVVAFEVQPGYLLGDFLLRAAMVAVSKGPPESAEDKTPADAPAAADPEPEA
ncbi:MAG: nucleotide exchange factor GrpE [Myxococcales bacterium]|nr:nucleotide exchange factor GrpE [Myxococcales bacterium]